VTVLTNDQLDELAQRTVRELRRLRLAPFQRDAVMERILRSDPDLKPVLPDLLTLYGRAKTARPLRLGSLIRVIRRDGVM
jgi:hypothetical protein